MQLSVPWRRGQAKPFGSIPRINWAHPLAQKLVSYVYDAGNGCIVDLFEGRLGTIIRSGGNSILNTSTRYGAGIRYQAGFADCSITQLNPVSSQLTLGTPYTIAAGLFQIATPDDATILCIRDVVSGNFGFELQTSTDHFFVIYVPVASGGDTRVNTSAGTNSLNTFHTFIAVADSATTGKVYCDGVLDQSPSGSNVISDAMGATNTYTCFNTKTNSSLGSGGINGFIYYQASWKRTLTATEARLLHDDPYCFLIYPEDEIFATLVGVAAGATIDFRTQFSSIKKIVRVIGY